MKVYTLLIIFSLLIPCCTKLDSKKTESTKNNASLIPKRKDLYIDLLVKKHSKSLNKQIKQLSRQFSKKEDGLNPEIIINGTHIQHASFNMDESTSNDHDIYPIIQNLYLSKNNPTIHIIGNKIYKQQKQSKNIYYRKVLKLVLHKSNDNWNLLPENVENWELRQNMNLKFPINIKYSIDDIYNARSYYLENKIYEEIRVMCQQNNYIKKEINDIIDQNIDYLINQINEHSKNFPKDEEGIKELHIMSKYDQVIPFDDLINNNYIKSYAAIYNIYLAHSNPKIRIIGKKIYKENNNPKLIYNNSLILDIIKFDKEINDAKFNIKKYTSEKIIAEQTSLKEFIIKDCNFCKIKTYVDDLSYLKQYEHRKKIYEKIKDAKKNQAIINSLVETNADYLLKQIKDITSQVNSTERTEVHETIYFYGAYRQSFKFDELEDKLKNTKIFQNPFTNYLIEYDLYHNPENINYIYPLIYNLYLAKEIPMIRIYYKKKDIKYEEDKNSPPAMIEFRPDYISYDLLINKANLKWTTIKIEKTKKRIFNND
ncbi:hypothetical protein [Borrelia persica]|uniref:hypothetical protein n=1 Tax=Borrelia persica TaxID=44448 RepID=UPI0004669202|nr:hypothetical protein [Borrelia persica]